MKYVALMKHLIEPYIHIGSHCLDYEMLFEITEICKHARQNYVHDL